MDDGDTRHPVDSVTGQLVEREIGQLFEYRQLVKYITGQLVEYGTRQLLE